MRSTNEPESEFAGRLLAFVDGDTEDSFATIATFLIALPLHVGLRHLHLGIEGGEITFLVSGTLALAAALGCVYERRLGTLRFAPLALPVTALLFASQKTALGNHAALETLLLVAIAIAVPITTARAATVGALMRWSCILLFLHSGLQKMVYGAYWNGSFLARQIHDERFAWVLELALPASEFQALQTMDRAGPMVLESVGGLLLSNAVYLSEVGCALLLLFPRTRALGFLASIATVIGIEVVAREVGFGLMFVLMLLLFRPSLYAGGRVLVGLLVVHALLALTQFTRPGWLLW